MSNNQAIIAKIEKVMPIPKADKVQIAIVCGEVVVVSKDWEVGMEGVYFPADMQLSEEYTRKNNLHRDSSLNDDKERQGFFDTNRKVRAQPFLGVKSEGFFAGLDTLHYVMDVNDVDNRLSDLIEEGKGFNELNGHVIAIKFISAATKAAKNKQADGNKKKTGVKEAPDFLKHSSTGQFKQNLHTIQKGDTVSIHAKVHGTSARCGYVEVEREKKGWWESVKAFFGVRRSTVKAYEYLVGSRNVTLYEDQYKDGFHGSNQFRFDVMEQLKPYLDEGMVVYGEIAGYANDKPIMGTHKGDAIRDKKFKKKYGSEITYTYGCEKGEMRFHIYRITRLDAAGKVVEFSDKEVKLWCIRNNFLHPFEVCPSFTYDGDVEALSAKIEALTERPDELTEDYIDPSHPSEGVIVRVDSELMGTSFLKSKSYCFRVLEGIFKETNIDVEDAS